MVLRWPTEVDALVAEQRRMAALDPEPWTPADRLTVAGCFLAFARGEQGPGNAGDRGWAAAAAMDTDTGSTVASACVPASAGARYEVGLLALREGPALAAAVSSLPVAPDVLIVDGTGRDHPRRAGLAVHLGAILGLPTIGVTHRPLLARGDEPGPQRGDWSPLEIDGEIVAAWVRTAVGVRPVAVHAAWRTDVRTALEVVLRCTPGDARTPEPLRRARVLARTTRAHAEGRTSQPWRDPI